MDSEDALVIRTITDCAPFKDVLPPIHFPYRVGIYIFRGRGVFDMKEQVWIRIRPFALISHDRDSGDDLEANLGFVLHEKVRYSCTDWRTCEVSVCRGLYNDTGNSEELRLTKDGFPLISVGTKGNTRPRANYFLLVL